MRASVLYFVRLLFLFIPETRCFALKNKLLRVSGVSIGKNVRICSSVTILGSGRLYIGDGTWLGHQVFISSSQEISIGSHVDIGPRVYLGTGTHEIDADGVRSAGFGKNENISIEDGVWLGANCMILPGVTIGKKSVVAAGAVVTKDMPPNVLVGGIPAKVIRQL